MDVRRMIGTVEYAGVRLRRSKTSKPSIPGIFTSRMTRFGVSSRAASYASFPFE